jgi:flavorubredoxin
MWKSAMSEPTFALDHRKSPEKSYVGSTINVDEIAPKTWRLSISTPPLELLGSFNYSCFLIADEDPLLYHTGKRGFFPILREAIERVMPVSDLRYISFAHGEADECGAMNYFLEAAPQSVVVTNKLGKMIHLADRAIRPPKVLADGETLSLGTHTVKWYDTPHMPHCWESGMIGDLTAKTLFVGDLLTQAGSCETPIVTHDLIPETEALRKKMSYVSDPAGAGPILDRLGADKPEVLAVMHGSSWRGDGQAMLAALGKAWAQN